MQLRTGRWCFCCLAVVIGLVSGARLCLGEDPASQALSSGDGLVAPEPAIEDIESQVMLAVQQASEPDPQTGEALLPTGTTLDAVSVDTQGVGHVWLTLQTGQMFGPVSEEQASAIDRTLRGGLSATNHLNGMDIQVRTGEGEYLPLGSYLWGSPFLIPSVDECDQDPAMIEAAQAHPIRADVAPTEPSVAMAGPSANADGQPSGALSGVVVFVSAGHGWTAGSASWYTQRPLLLDMVEDYGNLEQMNYLVNYLYNAGAVVVPFRPVGYQPTEIVLDNDDPGVTYTGSWTNSTTAAAYYENGATVSGTRYRWTTSSATETATARYTPTIPTSDFYPVYCWTRDNTDRVEQTYRIHHSGGTAVVKIDHQRVGKGWIWLGTFYFEAGTAGYVEISNQANTVSTVVADAIRFGNGVGDVVGEGPETVSGFLREEECARYWAESEAGINAEGLSSSIWDCCSTDGDDNVGAAARWAREMNREDINNDRWRRIFMEYHSNAAGCSGGPPCSAKGTVALYNEGSAGTANQLLYAQTVGQKLEVDMKALDDGFEYLWGSRYPNTYHASFAYGAISTGNNGDEFDATIMEVAFHDNVEDAANMLNTAVRDAVARSTLQGIITFLSNSTTFPGTQVPLAFPPEPPAEVRAIDNGAGGIVVTWAASPTGAALGHAATGYKVYRSTNGYGFGNPVDAGSALTITLTDVPADTTTYLRVAAYNAGGESLPSRTMAVRRKTDFSTSLLIVDGYNRVSRHQNAVQVIPAGAMQRPIARKVNSFDYVVQHATAMATSDTAFDYAENSAVISGAVSLGNYRAVVWILGQESTADKTFDVTEQALATAYLNAGGNLFVSGSEIGYELDGQSAGRVFYENMLRANYEADDAGVSSVTGSGGILADVGVFDFDTANGAAYAVNSPDRIAPQGGATAILSYGGDNGTAGIEYDSGTYRVVVFGFPFEAISAYSARSAVMQRVLGYILPPLGCPYSPDVITGFEGYADGTHVMFQDPRYSGSTLAHLAMTPNSAVVSSEVPAYAGGKTSRVDWAWLDASPTRWLRLTTHSAANVPNPTIDLRRPVRVRLRLDSGSFRLSLGIRETGVDVPIGENGGASGTIEWVGATSVVPSGGPVGILVSAEPGVWQTITFSPSLAPVQPMTGDGYLSAAYDKGVLEHLAFTITDTIGPITVYLDGIEQPCPPKADFDADGDVDQVDFGFLQGCLSGTSVPQDAPECQAAKLDTDGDVDRDDCNLFLMCLSGPGMPADPNCLN